MSDTPESKGLPSVQDLSSEQLRSEDRMKTSEVQKIVLKHPGIWIIAAASAFIYITKYAVAGWGVLFLQKEKMFSLESASQIIAFSAIFGVVVRYWPDGCQIRFSEATGSSLRYCPESWGSRLLRFSFFPAGATS